MGIGVNENEVLSAKDLSFTFSGASKSVIHHLSISLNRSEVFFLVGPSGMGKTTLLKVLAGILIPQSGEVFFQGAPLNQLSRRERRIVLQRVAMTFQRSGLFDSLSVLENLTFPLKELTHLSNQQCLDLARKALHQVEIFESESKFPYEISGGMQKRLGIARALVLQPEVILYDDPTAGLDPVTSRHIIDLIIQVQKEKNNATLIATSDLDLALQVSRKTSAKIGFLFEGQLLQVSTVSDLLNSNHPVIYQFTRGLSEGPLSAVDDL